MPNLNEYISNILDAFYQQNLDINGTNTTTSTTDTNDTTTTTTTTSTSDVNNVQYSMLELIKLHGDTINTSHDYTKNVTEHQNKKGGVLIHQNNNLNDKQIQFKIEHENNQRQHEINSYYYYKYKVQLNILYVFFMYVIFLIVCTFFRPFMGDVIYSILFGTSSACFLIFAGLKFYDIYLRSDIIFHEYDDHWTPSTPLNTNISEQETTQQDLEEKCKIERLNMSR